MLCTAQTAFTGLPASASRNIPMICSSLNRLLFMFCSFSQAELHLCHVPLLGASPVRQEKSHKKYNQQNLRSLLNEIIYLLSTHYIGFISLLPIALLGAL